jgi:hypothetical protein
MSRASARFPSLRTVVANRVNLNSATEVESDFFEGSANIRKYPLSAGTTIRDYVFSCNVDLNTVITTEGKTITMRFGVILNSDTNTQIVISTVVIPGTLVKTTYLPLNDVFIFEPIAINYTMPSNGIIYLSSQASVLPTTTTGDYQAYITLG